MSDGDKTAPGTLQPLTVRDAHLDEQELIDLAMQTLEGDHRQAASAHLDRCDDCREKYEALHRDVGGSTRVVDPLMGQTLGEYTVLEALSRGGMGAVYRGEQPMIGKKVAIKVLLPNVADDPEQMHRLLAEARAVNAIRHPNIIDIFSFGKLPDGRHYFVMELLDGLPLDEFLAQKGGRLKPAEVVTVLEQTMSALGAAHSAGVVHRDLKPANLFVTTLPDGAWHITVLDFGLAKQLGASSHTSPNLVMGTPGFMAPEQIRGLAVTARTDLYAMGVVAWLLLTGREPFSADSLMELMMRHLDTQLPSLQKLVPETPVGLVRVVERLLEKDPGARPQSAMEVRAELQRLRTAPEGVRSRATPMAPPPVEETRIMRQPDAPPEKPRHKTSLRAPAATTPELPRASGGGRTSALLGAGIGVATLLLAAGGWALLRPTTDVSVDTPRVDPVEKSADDTKAADTKAADTKADDTKADDTKADDTKADDTKADDTKADDTKAADTKAADTKAADTKAADTKAADTKAADTKAADTKAADTKPADTKPKVVTPKAPTGPTMASVKQRIISARETAARVHDDKFRRMMNAELDDVAARLKQGASPKELNDEVSDIVAKYKGR